MKKIFIALIFLTTPSIALAQSLRDDEGLTRLHRAAGLGDIEQISDLIRSGHDPLALDAMGVSVLHKAVYSGTAEAVNLVLKAGAPVDLQSPSNGNTPLHDAIYFRRGNDTKVIEALLAHKPSLEVRNRAGLTPLESARLLRFQDVAGLLERYEESRQSQASRHLMAAIHKNDPVLVAKLLKGIQKSILNEADPQGFTPLLWAAREGFSKVVKQLLDAGADPNQNDQWMGANAGHKAAFWGRVDVIKLLVAARLKINARGRYNGYTALHDAVSRGHFEVAQTLTAAGADKSIKGHDGRTALDIARANVDSKMIDLLQRPSF